MFIDIWDVENKVIKINKFDKDLMSSDFKKYQHALFTLDMEYGLQVYVDGTINLHFYKIEYKNSKYKYGFNQFLYFATLIDCFTFLMSDTFQYLFESEDIDFIKITAGKTTIFKYDNRG